MGNIVFPLCNRTRSCCIEHSISQAQATRLSHLMYPDSCRINVSVLALIALTTAASPQLVNAATSPRVGVLLDTVPFTGGREGYAVYRTPAVVVSQRGTILAFCEGRVNDHRDEGDIDTVLKRSFDGGRTWGALQVVANDSVNPCKNLCPVVLPSGRVLAVYLWNKFITSKRDRATREVFVVYSDNDGATWSAPRSITSSVYREGWAWYGTGPCHAIVKEREPHKGRIIVPARHNSASSHMLSHVVYSDDGGETWHLGGDVPRMRTSECTAVELSNGDIMLNSRNQDNSPCRVVAVSKDGGASFPRAWLDETLIEPRGCQGSLLFHSISATTGRGVILFSNPANATVRADGAIKLSEDDGGTWNSSFRYAPKPAPYFTGYSDLVKLPDGNIAILYERGEFEPDDRKADRYGEMGFTVVAFAALNAPSITDR